MNSTTKRGSVCIVRHSFYPFELNVKREAEALVADGYQVHVICLRDEGEATYEMAGEVHVHRLPVGHQRGKILRYLWEYNAFFALAGWKLLRLHGKHRFRAIQVNTMPDYLVFCTLIPKLLGAKVVMHVHEPMPELFGTMFQRWYGGGIIWAIKVAERMSVAFVDHALTVTREMRDNLGRRGNDVNKITVIVNVPDDQFFRLEQYSHLQAKIDAIKKEERRQGVFRILCHGAIEHRYGFDLIAQAVVMLKEDIPGIQFRFMGKGSYLDEVEEIARKNNAEDNIQYLGFVSFEEMIEEIMSADATIVPIKRNPYSVLVHTNKMYEYVALGRPCIASRLDSVAAYFPDDSLIYFEPGDAKDLAEKIRYVYAHPEDMQQRVLNATEVYETYRWDREKRKYLGVYDAILGLDRSEN